MNIFFSRIYAKYILLHIYLFFYKGSEKKLTEGESDCNFSVCILNQHFIVISGICFPIIVYVKSRKRVIYFHRHHIGPIANWHQQNERDISASIVLRVGSRHYKKQSMW